MSRKALLIALVCAYLAVCASAIGKAQHDDVELHHETTESDETTFVSAFVSSISMIFVSEIGDKTFFIAAIMAMKHNRLVIFTGALGALIVMTVLSAAMGFALPNLMPRSYTHYAAVVLFAVFGVRLIKEVLEDDGKGGPSEELEEVEQELEKRDGGEFNLDTGKEKKVSFVHRFVSPIWAQTFTLTFLAEWGDRSQISTIALAAAKNPYGVTLGGIIGHAFCTGGAVLGGRMLATKISPRSVNTAGGILFLLFAVHGLWAGPGV